MIRSYLLGFLSPRGLVTVFGVAALCVVIWAGGPYLSLFGWAPLVSAEARTSAIVLLLAGLIGVSLLRLYLARRANARMIKSLLDTGGLAAMADSGGTDEIEIIRERFEGALTTLKETIFAGRKGDAYLFELPWYVIIGPPGSGKTTILKNSGLDFPLARTLGTDPVAGLGGTRHCDWWFTDQAVLIDTAGRYTTHESNAAVDGAAWRGFLDLLKTHRGRRPLNGVVLAISLSDILLQNEVERKRHVAALRARLQELAKTFGVELPTYLLITKCDLIPGFSEFFDGLNETGRAQVWGMTFPPDANLATRLTELLDQNLRELADRLDQVMRERAHAERGLNRRGRIYLFPKEFAGLRKDLASFVHEIFKQSKFETQSRLRGVYFTSGTQEGTPIDRVLAAFGRSFGLTSAQRAPFSGQGKAFFVNRLLTDVIFEEQGLVGVDRKLERSLVRAQNIGYAVAAALVIGLGVLWWGAASRSQARIAATNDALAPVETRLAAVPVRATPATLLPVLQAADAVRDASGQGGILGWLDGFGLSATPSLAPAAAELRERLIVGRLYPAFAARLSERLTGLSQIGAENEAVRELLRSYLMLSDTERFDRSVVQRAAREEAQLAFPVDQSRAAELGRHFDELVALLPQPLPTDRRIIDSTRARLMRTPRSEQVYARLLREASQNPRLRSIDLSTAIGAGVLDFGLGRSGNNAVSVIPAAFTREAFYDFVLPRLPILIREELGIDWVTGGEAAGSGVVQTGTREVMDRYVADYIRSWQGALAAARMVPFAETQQALSAVQALAAANSPLERLIGIVRTNTELPLPGDTQPGALAGATAALPGPAGPAAGGLIAAAASSAANAAATAALGEGPWPGATIGAPFRPLVELVAPQGGAQAPMGRIRELFSGAYGALSNVSNAPDPRQAAYQAVARRGNSGADALGQLRADSALRPEPVRGIMRAVASLSASSVVGDSLDYVNQAWRRDVLPQCQAALDQRYPLFASAKDEVSLRDFSDMFRPGGLLDEFFQKHLAPFVTEQRNGYAPITVDGSVLPLKREALAQFYRARAIRNAFFAGSGSAPSLKFSLRPSFLDPKLLRATLALDGKDIVYRHEAQRAYDLEWPTKTDASTVAVTLTDLNGKDTRVERTGAWALLRMVDAASLAARGGADQFSITVTGDENARVVYQLRAASVNNPFNLGALRAFRCPDSL
ncbi:MAG: type VI secretion system membrane subunit TssM [Bosea sp.]|uniref:type VI secretion system membrane subunit TssM n=1 Tax=Bosea sp. (in: a-proteobacteria) TaxID=1871050 RepID=UPI00239C04F9|nr:type VI secretion system membrane subunit TssM [Bosea sp. (in: a-proteobacteria)]MCP4737573.1 type VI secretion system membrane subunit TssM [Bosea sp. (in: a-proteobacteria)]